MDDCGGQWGSQEAREWTTAIAQARGACDLNRMSEKILDILLRQSQQDFLTDQLWGMRVRATSVTRSIDVSLSEMD